MKKRRSEKFVNVGNNISDGNTELLQITPKEIAYLLKVLKTLDDRSIDIISNTIMVESAVGRMKCERSMEKFTVIKGGV